MFCLVFFFFLLLLFEKTTKVCLRQIRLGPFACLPLSTFFFFKIHGYFKKEKQRTRFFGSCQGCHPSLSLVAALIYVYGLLPQQRPSLPFSSLSLSLWPSPRLYSRDHPALSRHPPPPTTTTTTPTTIILIMLKCVKGPRDELFTPDPWCPLTSHLLLLWPVAGAAVLS